MLRMLVNGQDSSGSPKLPTVCWDQAGKVQEDGSGFRCCSCYRNVDKLTLAIYISYKVQQ